MASEPSCHVANGRITRFLISKNIYSNFLYLYFPASTKRDSIDSIDLIMPKVLHVFIYSHVYPHISNGKYTPYGVEKYASLNVTLEYKIEYACFYIVIQGFLSGTTQNRFPSAFSYLHMYICVCIYIYICNNMPRNASLHSHSQPARSF